MKKSEFTQIEKLIYKTKITRTGKEVAIKPLSYDKDKILSLSNELKVKACNYLVRERLPILAEFITDIKSENEWMYSMGYTYIYITNNNQLLGMCDHQSKINYKEIYHV